MHALTVKETWNYLDKLYLGNNNFIRVPDVIWEMFRNGKFNATLSQYYTKLYYSL